MSNLSQPSRGAKPKAVENRGVGRPKGDEPPKIKPSISIKMTTAEYLREVGGGNLSAGVEVVTEFHQRKFLTTGKKS